ncbi:MAG: TIGR04283 family arsenosugar biosynthesis glycosyltransferase [Bacteroidota bacterium]
MLLSIIIPTYNEEHNLPKLLERLCESQDERLLEIIVVDGGSKDKTCEKARSLNLTTVYACKTKSRACQMNMGAQLAQGDILYFVHADTLPPPTFLDDIETALEAGYPMGCYRFQFDSNRAILKFNSWLTRFDKISFRGGDQSLFIPKELFDKLGGFKEDHLIMEEYNFLLRARKNIPFKIIPKDIIVSARKYDNNSWLRVQFANVLVFNMYFLGYPQEKLVEIYRKLLRN